MFRLLLPMLLPVLISVLPFVILREERNRAQQLAFEQFKRNRNRNASLIAQQFRSNCTMEEQILKQAGQMKALLREAARKDSDENRKITANVFQRSFLKTFPPRRHPNGTVHWNPASEAIFLGFLPDGPDKVKVIPTSSLPSFRQRLFSRLVNEMLGASRLTRKELKEKDSLSKAVFGKYCKFEMLSILRKGMPTPVHYQNRRSFVIWDTIELGKDRLGAFLLVFPESMEWRGRPLRHALEQTALSRQQGMFPVLLPLEKSARPLRSLIPMKVPVPWHLDPLLKKVISSNRSEIASIGVLAFHSSFSAFRDIVQADIPFELWLLGPELPQRIQTSIDRIGFLILCWFGGIWSIVLIRTLITGHQLTLGLRTWLFAFFTLVGAIPLSALYFSGSSRIQTEMQRRIEETLRQTRQELESIDTGSKHLFNSWVEKCRSLFRDSEWTEMILSQNDDFREKSWEKIQEVLGKDGIDHALICRFGIGPDAFPPSPKLESELESAARAKSSLPAAFPFISFSAIYLEPKREKEFFKGFSGEIKQAAAMYEQTVDRNAKKDFLLVRATGDPIEFGGNLTFQYHDSITRNGHLAAWIILRLRALEKQRSYLSETISKMHLQERDRVFSFGRIRPGHVDFIASNHTIANRNEMSVFENAMALAARTRSQQLQVIGRKAYFAYAGSQMPSYVVGAIVDLHRYQREAQDQRRQLTLWTVFLFLPVGFIAWGVATYLIQPLSGIEQALTRVREGNLEVRTQMDREDELGEMSLAFDQMIRGLERRKRLTAFVSDTLNEFLTNGKEDSLVAPAMKQGAVLVSDLRSFTTLSETYPARKVVAMLNRHLEAMSEVIKAGGGLIDKFIGDAVVAIFYDRPAETGVQQAIRVALEMNRQHRLIQQSRQLRGDFTYRMGIGIDCGSLLVGTIRSKGRHEQTVMGDARQNADRLEGLSRNGSHTRIILSQSATTQFPEGEYKSLDDGTGFELVGLMGPAK